MFVWHHPRWYGAPLISCQAKGSQSGDDPICSDWHPAPDWKPFCLGVNCFDSVCCPIIDGNPNCSMIKYPNQTFSP